MVDHLREERVRARRAASVPQPGAAGVAVRRGHPGLRSAGRQPQPGGGTAARPARGTVVGRRLDALGVAARRRARRARARRRAPGRPARRAARQVSSRHVRRPRLHPQLPADRGADRGAAAVRARRLREADSGDVARGQQHRDRVELAAALVADLRRRPPRRPTATTSNRPSASSSSGPSSWPASCAASPTCSGCRRR